MLMSAAILPQTWWQTDTDKTHTHTHIQTNFPPLGQKHNTFFKSIINTTLCGIKCIMFSISHHLHALKVIWFLLFAYLTRHRLLPHQQVIIGCWFMAYILIKLKFQPWQQRYWCLILACMMWALVQRRGIGYFSLLVLLMDTSAYVHALKLWLYVNNDNSAWTSHMAGTNDTWWRCCVDDPAR